MEGFAEKIGFAAAFSGALDTYAFTPLQKKVDADILALQEDFENDSKTHNAIKELVQIIQKHRLRSYFSFDILPPFAHRYIPCLGFASTLD